MYLTMTSLLTCGMSLSAPIFALLTAARDGFAEQGAAWEVARNDLIIAEVLGVQALDGDARARLDAAIELFERLGSVAELRRARAAAPS